MIMDERGRRIVLITTGSGEGRIGAIDDSRPGDCTTRIDLGGMVVEKARGDFRPLTIGETLVAA